MSLRPLLAALVLFASLGAAIAEIPVGIAAPLTPSSLGTRLAPLADAPEYGELAPVAGSPVGAILVATRDGAEVRLESSPGGVPAGRYRGAEPVRGVAGQGTAAYLFHGAGGLSLLDISDPAAPGLRATLVLTDPTDRGAVLSDGSCVAASDSFLQVIRLENASDLRFLERISFPDDRRVVRVRAHGDSVLVIAVRGGALQRLYLTLYRLPSGAESLTRLQEWLLIGSSGVDLAWDGRVAFVADGNSGIRAIDVTTGALLSTTPLTGSLFARGVAMDAASVFAIGEAGTLQRFDRTGTLGETLQPAPPETMELEPVVVATAAGRALVSSRDVVAPLEPDEVGRSSLEFPASAAAPVSPIPPVRSIGRARRVLIQAGLAYVADYSGGLRVYRAGGADTSLVGVLPALGVGRALDLALDPAQARLYLASGASGLEVVDVSDPAAPTRIGTLPLPGLATAVVAIDATTVGVARTGSGASAGVTLVDVTTPTAPSALGAVNAPFVLDPRSLAVRDTVLFVADDQLGLLSIGISNRDAPATFGLPTGSSARDLDLQGSLLLVATRADGVAVVDVNDPSFPIRRSSPFLPATFGVARQGASAVACLGEGGAALLDLTLPTAATVRSVVAAGGRPRDAAWSGDTLLIAAGTSIERFLLPPAYPPAGGLSVTIDPDAVTPRALVGWTAAPAAGQIGWNVLRDRGVQTAGTPTPGGVRVNATLLDPATRETTDDGLQAGLEHRYRLEAVYADGRLSTVAEGKIFVSSNARVGRPYPNPSRPGTIVSLPYRVLLGGGQVTLRVVDVRGRLVRTVSAPAPAAGGFGSIRWDGRDGSGHVAPSGVYYLHLRGPGLDDARPVVHLR